MTVGDLIRELQSLPSRSVVRVRGEEYDWTENITVWACADLSVVSIEADD